MDTLSWARLGTKVTGVDLSDVSIKNARKLADELSIEARFIASDIYKLPEMLHEQFDVVYTSECVLGWLPDILDWAKVVYHFLKPGGTFYIRDGHSFVVIIDDDLKISRNYFHEDKPIVDKPRGSYAYSDEDPIVTNESYEWRYSMSDIINALIQVGLKIQFLHEVNLLYCFNLLIN